MYSIDFDKLVSILIPWFLRKETMLAWLRSLIHPLTLLYADFLLQRTEKLFEASITGQIMMLEYMLNKEFYNDGSLRTIYLADDTSTDDIFLFNKSELEDETYIYNASEDEPDTFIFNINETTGYDFIVYVPSDLVFDMDYMFSLVSKYKEAGPSFKIETY